MNIMLLFGALAITTMVMSNFLASVYIGHTALYTRRRKTIEIALIWLLPYLASALLSLRLWRRRQELCSHHVPMSHTIHTTRQRADFYAALSEG